MKALKGETNIYLDLKMKIEPIHITATFLYPSFRDLNMIEDEKERNNAFDDIRKLLKSVELPALGKKALQTVPTRK